MQHRKLLFRCKTVFPFDLFPTTIEIDKEKITIIYGIFFFTNHTVSILLKDLVNIKVTTGILFSSAKFEIRYFESNPEQIRFLTRADGKKLREIVTGMIQMTENENIEVRDMSSKKIMKQSQEAGTTDEPV